MRKLNEKHHENKSRDFVDVCTYVNVILTTASAKRTRG